MCFIVMEFTKLVDCQLVINEGFFSSSLKLSANMRDVNVLLVLCESPLGAVIFFTVQKHGV